MLTKNHWYLNADGVIVSFHRKSQIALNPLKNNYKKYELRVDGKVVDRHEYKGGMFEAEGKMFAIIESGEPVALRVDIREDASLERIRSWEKCHRGAGFASRSRSMASGCLKQRKRRWTFGRALSKN